MRYAIVIEKANGNHSAYVPDLPGCVAARPGGPGAAPQSDGQSTITGSTTDFQTGLAFFCR
jgi:hypothetical protein